MNALIEDPAVRARMLSWLGVWEPPRLKGPSLPPKRARLPLSYHPMRDIA